jgi:16S rRNA (adenine1518-N6/adenine1519-N6)-dimethyltransferase
MKIIEETKFIMKKYGIYANKSLGQNFLIDDNAVNNIVEVADVSEEDLVIEIGPGLGTLTKELLEKSKKVIAIELDIRMISILKDRFALYENLEIINEDVLKVNLDEIIKKEKQENNIKSVKIVANLPYYITTPIIMKLLEDEGEFESITVMIQKEVAERLCAVPGGKNSGAITYTVYYYAEAKKVLEVKRDCFIPVPNVDSEVINLKIRKEPPVKVDNKEKLFKIIKYAFMQRRKTLINALSKCDLFNDRAEIKNILDELNISEKIRGEELTLEDFAMIESRIQ